jgi:hypothetical protein
MVYHEVGLAALAIVVIIFWRKAEVGTTLRCFYAILVSRIALQRGH